MANNYTAKFRRPDSQYASITDGSQTGLDITGDLSIEFWVYLTQLPSVSGVNHTMVAKSNRSSGDGTGEHSYYVYATTGNVMGFRWFLDSTNTYSQTFTDSVFFTANDLGNWVHVACTLDVSAKNGTIYKNGKAVASTDSDFGGGATSIYNSSSPFSIGSRQIDSSYAEFIYGQIDEVRVWDDIRSASEIADNMTTELVGNEANLQAYWQFEDDWTDKTANANTLTPTNGPEFDARTPWLDGGGSFLFEKPYTQYLQITDANQTGLDITGDISIEGWFMFTNLASTAGTISLMSKNDNAAAQRSWNWRIFATGDVLQFTYSQDGAAVNLTVETSDAAIITNAERGQWIHLAVTADVSAQDVRFYKNGTLVASTASPTLASSIFNSTAQFAIGAYFSTTPLNPANGYFSDCRVWSDVRTITEIQDNMNTELVGDEANLEGYWKLDGNLLDETSNQNWLTNTYTGTFRGQFDTMNQRNTTGSFFNVDAKTPNTMSVSLQKSNSEYLLITDATQSGLDIAGDITIEAWVKMAQLPSTAGSSYTVVSKYWRFGGNRQYKFTIGSGDDRLYFEYSTTGGVNVSSAKCDTVFGSGDVSRWIHVACAVDVSAQGFNFYINGELQADTVIQTNASDIQNTTAPFAVGCSYGASATPDPEVFFDGLIDQVRMWGDLRTAQEIKDNYRKQIYGFGSGLVSDWSLNYGTHDLDTNATNTLATGAGKPSFSRDAPPLEVGGNLFLAF